MITRRIVYITTLLLLASFFMHIVDFDHEHPHVIFGDGQEAIFHGEQDKIWLVMMLVYIVFCSNVLGMWVALFLALCSIGIVIRIRAIDTKIYNYLVRMFRKGITQPLLYA